MNVKKLVGRRIGLAGVAAVALAASAVSPAHAWSWSSSVTVKGSAGCSVGGPEVASVRGVLNGQYQSSNSGLQINPQYAVTFTNVPSGGGWAWFWVDCSVSSDHGRWVWVYRPSWGSTITANLW